MRTITKNDLSMQSNQEIVIKTQMRWSLMIFDDFYNAMHSYFFGLGMKAGLFGTVQIPFLSFFFSCGASNCGLSAARCPTIFNTLVFCRLSQAAYLVAGAKEKNG